MLKALPSWREFRELLQTPVARENDAVDDDDDDEEEEVTEEEKDDDDEVNGPGTQEKPRGSPRGASGERDDAAQLAPMRLSFEAEDWSALAGDCCACALPARRLCACRACAHATAAASVGLLWAAL